MADILPVADKDKASVTQEVDSEQDTYGENDEEKNSFLKNVYLQKSPYVIKGKIVEKIED